METHTVVFQEPIRKFEDLLTRLKDCSPILVETPSQRRALRNEVKCRVPSGKGIYVLYEHEKPLYVGRTDQMADRLFGHTRKPSSDGPSAATFALILAKNDFKKAHSTKYDLFSKEMARELNEHRKEKIELWKKAVERVQKMSVRVVEVEHPHEQSVFEVYVHERLKTAYNSFANH